MNISQLETFSLAESAKFKDHLNPTLWDRHENLKNAVRDQILVGAEEYCRYLGLTEEQVVDIVVTGSAASYLYESTGIDVVVVAELNQDETFREFFNEHKYKYNGQHRVEVEGHLVQFYVQPAEQSLVTSGSYSVLRESWVQIPVRRILKEDTVKQLKAQDRAAQPKPARVIKKKIVKERRPVVYGFGQDYLAEVGLTPDGVSASTCQFANETTHEQHQPSDKEIIQDFVAFCSKMLNLESSVNLKIKRDPQWSVRNKTFGRYDNDRGVLEVAVGQRHIMDVLRTVAHELTHQRQHETKIVPPDAGEDGSPFENEANASAGVLMRLYGKRHPELFSYNDLHETDIEEGWGKRAAATAATVAALSGAPAQAGGLQDLLGAVRNIGTAAQTMKGVNWNSMIQGEVNQELWNYIRANGGDPTAQNLSQLYQWQRQMQRDQGQQQQSRPFEPMNESSGYIPTAAQAHDPRFEMALSVDVRPGALGKAANALDLNTDSQGHPQLLRTDGVVDRLYEEYKKFKV